MIIAGCSDGDTTRVEGSGNVITETRPVGDFDRISVEGFGLLNVQVGPATSLSVDAEDNVLPHLVTNVEGDTLTVGSSPDVSFSSVEEPVYTITTPALVSVSIAGSGDVTATGIQTGSFEVSISGSGDVEPAGVTSALDVSIDGSGDFRGEGLVAETAEVDVNGSGRALVNATDSRDASVNGSGRVTYLGDPTLTESVSGSGSITPG
jgi:hypothetical protein